MPYIENAIVHDADAHIVEMPDCLDPYFDPGMLEVYYEARNKEREFRARMTPLIEMGAFDKWAAKHDDPEFRAGADENVHKRKMYDAAGAFRAEDRPHVLDLQGYASQLIFTSLCLRNFDFDKGPNMDLAYASARAHNRMIVDYCSVDRRLLPVAYIPIADMERTAAEAKYAIELGAKALMIPAHPPETHSHAHVGLEPLWAMAQEAGLPIVFHIAGTELPNGYKQTGRANVNDTVSGGDGDHNSLGLIAIPHPILLTLSALMFDGVMCRYPNLKFGVIELGASWLPSLMKLLDSSVMAFSRHEERLRQLTATPSEIIRRQVRVTPYPTDDTGWIIANSGPEICMYSSDYPHPEGGTDPMRRFRASIEAANLSQVQMDRFLRENYIDMMGEGLAPDLRYPKHLVAA